MKKIISWIIFLCCCYSSTQAQLRVGISSGLNIANITQIDEDLPSPDLDIQFGPYISITPSYQLKPWLFFDTDIQYLFQSIDQQEGIKLHYARLTPQITVSPHPTIRLSSGIYGALATRDKLEFGSSDFENRLEQIDYFKDMDWGFSFGIRGVYKRFYLEASYHLGMANITSDTCEETQQLLPPNIDIDYVPCSSYERGGNKNRNIQIGIGYEFGSK